MKLPHLPTAVCAAAFGAVTTASAQTVTQVALDYNFNGIVHAGEGLLPDAPNAGYRSISDRGLDFSLGVPGDALFAPYLLVDSADALDVVVGNRNTVDGGNRVFDSFADGDDNGISLIWLANPDQTGPQTTTLGTPIAALGVLHRVLPDAGQQRRWVTRHRDRLPGSATSSVSAPDWAGRAYAGVEATDRGTPWPAT